MLPCPPCLPPSRSGLASGPVSDQSPRNLKRLTCWGDLKGYLFSLFFLEVASFFNFVQPGSFK